MSKKDSGILYEVNKYQTPITKELKRTLNPAVYANVIEFINSVEFVKKLVAPDRPTVKQMPKLKGKVQVSIENPHILENMEFFIRDRMHFDKFGYYTANRFSRDPKSSYRKYWDEQKRRSLEGYVNKTTKEWIPGYLYFYWNFGRILRTEEIGTTSNQGKIRSDRVSDFPDIWEIDYFYYHYIEQAEELGEYAALLKCRGMGASVKAANMTIRNFFLIKQSKSYVTASFDGFLYEDGTMSKVQEMEAFMQSSTAFKKQKIFSKPSHYKAGFKDKALNDAHSGFLSEIFGVNVKDANSIRGKRGKLMIHEEFGSNRNGLDVWRIADRSLNDRGNVFGLQLGQGTGGADKVDFYSLIQIFFKPKSFSVHHIKNVFDKNSLATVCGFFMGDYMNKPRSYNASGVTDVVMNLISIFTERKVFEDELDDPDEIAKKKAETAITPLEAITTMTQSSFPKELAKQAIAELSGAYEERTKGFHNCTLKRSGETVSLIHGSQYFPIIEYPYMGKQAHNAAVTIKSMPNKHSDGSIPSMRYIIGADVIENDDTYGSLFAIQVMDLWKDDIVAWYLGRHVMVEEDFDIVLNLCLLYNATCNYENNLKGLYGHFKNKNALRYLADTPTILVDKGYTKSAKMRLGNSAHPYSEYVNTPTGIKSWKDIVQGSILFDANGDRVQVENIPFDGLADVYEIELFDGRKVKATDEHLWRIKSNNVTLKTLKTTKYLFNNFKRQKVHTCNNKIYDNHPLAIPVNSKVKYHFKKIPIDPYTLGLLLGDGSLVIGGGPTCSFYKVNIIKFTSGLKDLKTYKKEVPYEFTEPSDDRHMYIKIPNIGVLLHKLKLINTRSSTKFIPEIYKRNSVEVRLAILQGLLDTDGHVDTGMPIFSTTSKRLSDDVMFIARSLGYNTKKYKNPAGYRDKSGKYIKCSDCYTVIIWTTDKLFRLKRKYSKQYKNPSKKIKSRINSMTIVNVKYIGKEKSKCITIRNLSGLYLINDFIVTHNSKGTRAIAAVNVWGNRLQAAWMRKEHIYYEGKLGIDTIDDIEYLREVSMFDPLGNFDKISCGNMLFIYREDLVKVTESSKFDTVKQYEYNTDEFFDDDFVTTPGKAEEFDLYD